MKNINFVRLILIPGFLFLFVFSVIPVFYGLGISFFDYNPARNENPFLGFSNYSRMFQDEVFWKALKNTVIFSVAGVLANIVITLFLAQLIAVLPTKKVRTLFRTILFVPCIAPIVGTSVVWKHGFLETNGGILNQLLQVIGIPPKNWFGTTGALLIIIIIYTLWADIGYNVVLFSAGIESVPKEFDEAAKIDGAGAIKRFSNIRLPLMARTFAFVFIMTMANYFQMFAQFKVLAPGGGIQDSAMVLTNYVYKQSFTNNDMGYASTVSMALFVVIFAVASLQNKIMRIDWSYE